MESPGRRRNHFIDRRKHLGFTQESLAQALEVSTSSIAQWERGVGTPTPRHRRKLAALLEVGLNGLDRLLDPDGAPLELAGHLVPSGIDHWMSLEQAAAEIWSFDLMVMPGILQTRSYAHALMSSFLGRFSEDQIASRLEIRLSRQQALTRPKDPVRFLAIIDESVLLRPTGSTEVMVEQLDHLLSMSHLPNLEIRVLPLRSNGHASAIGPFWLPVKPGATEPFMVCIENFSTFEYGEIRSMVEDHIKLFRHLQLVAALDPLQSVERISRARNDQR